MFKLFKDSKLEKEESSTIPPEIELLQIKIRGLNFIICMLIVGLAFVPPLLWDFYSKLATLCYP